MPNDPRTEPPSQFTFEPLDEDEILQLAEGIAKAWRLYAELFGEAPHGTVKQIAALLELVHGLRAEKGEVRDAMPRLR